MGAKTTFKIIIFLLLMNFLIFPAFTQINTDDIEIGIKFDDKMVEKHLDLVNKIAIKLNDIIWLKLLPMYFENLKLSEGDPKRLPSCVIEAMNEFLKKKEINFEFFLKDIPSFLSTPEASRGAVKTNEKSGEFIPLDRNEIIIYGLYQETYYPTLADWKKGTNCPQKPPDHQDDNFSFSTGSEVNDYKLAPEALIYKGGFYYEAVNLFGGLLWDGENSAEELLKISRTLICPSGAMYSHENDSTLKNILEEYVRRGGSLIILCQQYGIACGPIGICEQKRKNSNFFC